MKIWINRIGLATVLVTLLLNLTACQNGGSAGRKTGAADSLNIAAENLVRAMSKTGDVERTSALSDSLMNLKLLPPIKADFYIALAYVNRGDEKTSYKYLKKIIDTYDDINEEPRLYSRVALTLGNHYVSLSQYEEALRVTLPAMQALGPNPNLPSDRKGRLLTIIGGCQKELNRTDEADKNFEQAYQYFQKYMEEDYNLSDFAGCINAVSNMSSVYEGMEALDEQQKWTDRCDSLLTWYRKFPKADSVFVDRMDGLIALKRAEILLAKGKKGEAAMAYEQFCKTAYSKSDIARIFSCDYLGREGRYADAANIFQDFDRIAAEWGMTPNLEVINGYLIPKFTYNYKAGRKDSALVVATKIAELMDSAITVQKNDAAAELATIYETQQKEAQIARQQVELSKQRVVGLIIVIAFLTLSFLIYTIVRHRAAKRLAEVRSTQERIENELKIARDIQMSMVPSRFPNCEGLDMYASMMPAREVGGDLYSYVLLGDYLYFCIGDVSGKGVPASLLMTQTIRLFHALASQGMTPAQICTRMNDELTEDNEQGMFVTMLICRLHQKRHLLEYCNAGHNPPVLGNADGQFSFLDMEPNAPFGLWPRQDYKGESIDYFKDRLLLLYTDGLNEAENRQQEQFGDDRLLDILSNTRNASSRQIVETMAAAVSRHRDGAESNDDLTLMCVRVMN